MFSHFFSPTTSKWHFKIIYQHRDYRIESIEAVEIKAQAYEELMNGVHFGKGL